MEMFFRVCRDWVEPCLLVKGDETVPDGWVYDRSIQTGRVYVRYTPPESTVVDTPPSEYPTNTLW